MIDSLCVDGLVVVRGAMDPGFCGDVVADAFDRMGVREENSRTWPRGRTNLPVVRNWSLEDVAPRAAAVLHELIPAERISFSGVQDNLIVNLPDPAQRWWPPEDWGTNVEGWHKDGDWFRHFLDSPEQALLVIVFWRDVTADQGATYAAIDSVGPMARFLADHPEGLDPVDLKKPVRRILGGCTDFRALTGRQGDIAFAHPFMLHTASVNGTARPRIISNSSVMLREPMRFDRQDVQHTAVERSILHHLGVDEFAFTAAGERGHVVSERERRWRSDQQPSSG